MKNIIKNLTLTLVGVILVFSGAQAQVNVPNPIEAESVPALVNSIVKAILGIVGALALLMFVYGGVLWLTSLGNKERIKKGQDVLTWATIGLLIIFSSYAILTVVFQALSQ